MILGIEDRLSAELSSLYKSRGYKKYKMGSFEEYSVYLDNKDFLISKNVITFGGLDGRLMALRPDVTLSIIKNVKADETSKLFYNEKVYRAVGEEYKEVSQTGVEVIGDIDLVTEAEITGLILSTLDKVGKNYFLDVSHIGFVEGLIDYFSVSEEDKNKLYALLKAKNVHDILKEVPSLGEDNAKLFEKLITICGSPEIALKEAEEICVNQKMKDALKSLKELFSVLKITGRNNRVNINFSIANNADYYSGLIFNGYIEGIPKAVLSGGRYDKLVQKFEKSAGAIGFALYLGEIARYFSDKIEETDALIIYGNDAVSALTVADEFVNGGLSVRLSKENVSGRFKKVYVIENGKAKEIKNA